jgi:Holliday junction DNA helicase RuvA
MIASVDGTVRERRPDHVVIVCGGVGYRLNVSAWTPAGVAPVGGHAMLLAHLIPRDDAFHLFGFGDEDERELFLRLISVAGVGPKMALAVLSGSSPPEVGRAIAAGDLQRFQRVPGVGKKTAERIIVELREKIPDALVAARNGNGTGDGRLLAREGLVGLGYDVAEAEQMLEVVATPADEREPEDLIAAALRAAARGR